jgi:uncharacterized protein (TIGR01244 family)
MLPFPKPDASRVSFRGIDSKYATAAQLGPEQLRAVADAGFRTVVCARPDHEEPGQPTFAEIAAAASAAGLKSVHIPVSGQLTEGALIRMEKALAELPAPFLGYCRSGARAGPLYAVVNR